MATIEFKSSLLASPQPARALPYRVLTACAGARLNDGTTITIIARESHDCTVHLELMAPGYRTARAKRALVTTDVVADMLQEAGLPEVPDLASDLSYWLDTELTRLERERARRAKLLAKLTRLERERAGRAKLLAKLLQVTV